MIEAIKNQIQARIQSDRDHVMRVFHLATIIADHEKANRFIVQAGFNS